MKYWKESDYTVFFSIPIFDKEILNFKLSRKRDIVLIVRLKRYLRQRVRAISPWDIGEMLLPYMNEEKGVYDIIDSLQKIGARLNNGKKTRIERM